MHSMQQRLIIWFQMIFDASNGPASLTTVAENVRRMVVLMFDYANTLKPIADIQPEEKVKGFLAGAYLPFLILAVLACSALFKHKLGFVVKTAASILQQSRSRYRKK